VERGDAQDRRCRQRVVESRRRRSDQQRAERNREYALDVERFSTSIQKVSDEIKNMPGWSAAEAENLARRAEGLMRDYRPSAPLSNWFQSASEITKQAPTGRIMKQISGLLDPKELASLPLFYKTVWSSNPTAMQRQLPREIWPCIEQFWQGQAEWSAAADRHNLNDPVANLGNYWLGGFSDSREQSGKGIGKVLLSATRSTPGGGVSLEFSAYDERGSRIGQSSMTLGEGFDGYMGAMKEDPASQGERMIQFDGESKMLLSALGGSGRPGQPIPADLLSRVARADLNDPLSYLISPALIQSAEIKGVNMVACLPDSAVYGSLMGRGGDVHVNQILTRLSFFQTTYEIKDGWLVVKPSRPNEARVFRADRTVLAKYLQRLSSGKPLIMEEAGYFAARFPDRVANSLPQQMARFFPGQQNDSYNQEMLRLYGLLTQEQKQRMVNGGLPLKALTQVELDQVGRMIYGASPSLQYRMQIGQPGRSGPQQSDWMLFNTGLLHEATESLPTGIPPQASIKVQVNDSYVVVPSHEGANSNGAHGQMMNAQTLAWVQFSQERPDLFPYITNAGQRTDLSNLEYGVRIDLVFTIDLTPTLSIVQSLDGRGDSDFVKVTLDSVPDDFKKKYLQAYQNYKRAYANARPGQGIGQDGGVPPPS